MRANRRNLLIQSALAAMLVVLVGCSMTKETKSAMAALDSARAAGKDKQCPAEFRAAEDLVLRAQALCHQCKPAEADALAREALAKANDLCPKPVAAAPAPAPAPAPEVVRVPAPTVSLSASPTSVDAGSCATLTWSTSNATSVTIDPGVGTVEANGSKQVCPTSTTRYTLTANGTGGSRTDSTSIEVRAKPTAKLTIHVNFDTAKSTIRKTDLAELKKAEEFVRKYPTCKIEVDGHTDSRGSDEYNQGLSERRAEAVKKWLADNGASSGDQISTKGFGETQPIADNKTEKGRFENRRAEILIFCQ
jgi:OmpA-OmpF porin, OOP family